jgi:DNA ligase 1
MEKIKYPVLYSKTQNDNIQQWQIIVENNSFYTIEGILNGKLTTSVPTICEGKNIGKKNETSAHEQAVKEAEAKIKKKKEKGYTENIDNVDDGAEHFEPMLAKKYGEVDFTFPVYEQSKIDGCRCIVTKNGMFSRNGKPILSAPHIFEAIKHLFKDNPNLVFDGELYNHNLKHDFNKIISLVKKTKPTKQDLIDSKKYIQYYVYDLPSKDKFSKRSKDLHDIVKSLNSEHIVFLKTNKVNNQKELDEIYTKSLQEGYEGQMIRIDNVYENKRSKFLLKRKEFIDEEFEIIDIEEGVGNRSGMMGRIVLKTKDGKTFESNARGNQEYYIELLKNKNEYIGKQATIRYQNLTPDNIPRFPVCVAIRDYE